MTTITNPDLLKAIRVLHISDNIKTRDMLYRALLASTLILPIANPDLPAGEVALSEGLRLNLIQSQTAEGDPLVLMFSDVDALQRWSAEPMPYVVFEAPQLFGILAQTNTPHLMLNIAGTVGGEFTPTEIRALAQGIIPTTAQGVETEDTPQAIEVLPPHVKVSSHLYTYLERLLSSHDTIHAAYIFSIRQEMQPLTLAVGIHFDAFPQDADAILRDFTSQIPAAIVKDGLSVLVLDGELLAFVQQHFSPAYQRP